MAAAELLNVAGRGGGNGLQGLLPGRILQRFAEQIFDMDGSTVLKTVEVPQLQFIVVGLVMQRIETVAENCEGSAVAVSWVWSSSWIRLSTCPSLCSALTRWSMSLLCRSSTWVSSSWTRLLICPLLCKSWVVVLKTVEVPQLQFIDKTLTSLRSCSDKFQQFQEFVGGASDS